MRKARRLPFWLYSKTETGTDAGKIAVREVAICVLIVGITAAMNAATTVAATAVIIAAATAAAIAAIKRDVYYSTKNKNADNDRVFVF